MTVAWPWAAALRWSGARTLVVPWGPGLGVPAGRHRVAVSALAPLSAVTRGLSPRAMILRIPQLGWEGQDCFP